MNFAAGERQWRDGEVHVGPAVFELGDWYLVVHPGRERARSVLRIGKKDRVSI